MTPSSKTIQDAAISFEAVKVSMNQNKDGYMLRLCIHPNDVPDPLLRAWVGARYQVVMVELSDDDKPKVPEAKRKADRLVVAAGMLCREQKFWDYMEAIGLPLPMSEDDARESLCSYLGIGSRTELVTNTEAREMFDGMKGEFEGWMK